MEKYKALILDPSREFDVDPHLIHAVIQVESSFRPDALSSSGAAGLMQIMPETFVEAAQALQLEKPDIWDPAQNIRCGTYYLRRQYDKFPTVREKTERWQFALASYNCGAGYVQIAYRLAEIRHGSLAGCWGITAPFLSDPQTRINDKRPLAIEVMDYVQRVMVEFYRARSLAIYGSAAA